MYADNYDIIEEQLNGTLMKISDDLDNMLIKEEQVPMTFNKEELIKMATLKTRLASACLAMLDIQSLITV